MTVNLFIDEYNQFFCGLVRIKYPYIAVQPKHEIPTVNSRDSFRDSLGLQILYNVKKNFMTQSGEMSNFLMEDLERVLQLETLDNS